MIRHVKNMVKYGLSNLGYIVKKKRSKSDTLSDCIRPLLKTGTEAAYHKIHGNTVAFKCPLDKCVHPLGWNYKKRGWTPHAHTSEKIATGAIKSYIKSPLHRYYQIWQPSNAGDVCPGLTFIRSEVRFLPGFAIRCSPWISAEADSYLEMIKSWFENDSEEHYGRRLAVTEHGYKSYGPVTQTKGKVEFNRLSRLVSSLNGRGYRRDLGGDVMVTILRRGTELRFLQNGSGYHRMAVMAALDFDWAPARFYPFSAPVVNIRDVVDWPGVRSGLWDKDEALKYFNHLFDFDGREWAAKMKILS